MVNGALSFKPNPTFLTPIASADRQPPDSSAMSLLVQWLGLGRAGRIITGPTTPGADV
jgi:hypothetical protein